MHVMFLVENKKSLFLLWVKRMKHTSSKSRIIRFETMPERKRAEKTAQYEHEPCAGNSPGKAMPFAIPFANSDSFKIERMAREWGLTEH
jgi:hypothetical protein